MGYREERREGSAVKREVRIFNNSSISKFQQSRIKPEGSKTVQESLNEISVTF